MSNFSPLKGLTKQNQQFNEITVYNSRVQEINNINDKDLIINSSQKSIVLNDNVIVNSLGELELFKKINLLNLSSDNQSNNQRNDKIELYNDDNNLIWGGDVVITDATLEREIENLETIQPPIIGTIILHAGYNIPRGWLLCNGQLLNIDVYPQLFEEIEYEFGGEGDYFNIPRLYFNYLENENNKDYKKEDNKDYKKENKITSNIKYIIYAGHYKNR